MKRETFVLVISWLFILLFAYAAVSKLADYAKFTTQLGQSPLLTPIASWVAWVIPSMELFICILLLSRRFQLFGLYGAFSLMILFTAYIVAITNFSDTIPCSCGGVLQNMNWHQHLLFNILFCVLALTAILLDGARRDFALRRKLAL